MLIDIYHTCKINNRGQSIRRYFSLFMNLLNDCSSGDSFDGADSASLRNGPSALAPPQTSASASDMASAGLLAGAGCNSGIPGAVLLTRRFAHAKMEQLRCVTVEAMSNLLSANIDSGLVHSLGELEILLFVHVHKCRQAFHRSGIPSRFEGPCCFYGSAYENFATRDGI